MSIKQMTTCDVCNKEVVSQWIPDSWYTLVDPVTPNSGDKVHTCSAGCAITAVVKIILEKQMIRDNWNKEHLATTKSK
jgi:hypothetical protein